MSVSEFLNSQRKILVVGDAMLDRYFEGSTERISPEAPVPVLKVAHRFDRPGGAANVALNIAALGIPVTLLAYIGNDDEAKALQTLLEAGGVQCDFIVAQGACTILKLRALSMRQQMLRIDFEDDFSGQDHDVMLLKLDQHLASHDLVVLSDYGKGTLDKVTAMITASKAVGKPVLVDPKGSDFSRYRGATVITPNISEFSAIAGIARDEDDLVAKGQSLCAEYAVENLLVTRGEKGMMLIKSGREVHSIPAEAQEVFDVTGAGDTVIGTIAATMVSGLDLVDAMQVANFAAGIVVSRKGTAAVSAAELQGWRKVSEKMKNEAPNALAQIAAAQNAGQSIVMTNGCFDILHAGHVDYLTKARALGDRLVIAVNNDASVGRLKGPCRPINRLEHRIAVLAALQVVDWVVSFDGSVDAEGKHSDTPLTIIRTIKPDILVKGGDYSVETVVGAEEVLAAGGRVEIVPFVEELSSSNILKKI